MEATMLKKLVKYGNSNALVLDRAILELLNISEGAVVKLHTDGKSLIITPQQTEQSAKIFATGTEMVANTIESNVKKQIETLKADPIKSKQLNEWAPGTDNFTKLQQAYAVIMQKYKEDVTLLQTEAYAQDIEKLTEKYHNEKQSPEFIKELLAIRLKHAPNLVNMDKEMSEANKALGLPEGF